MKDPSRYLVDRSRPRSGIIVQSEGLASLILGTLACGLVFVQLFFLPGENPHASDRFWKKAIVIQEVDRDGKVVRFAEGWWYVPTEEFFAPIAAGLLLAGIGLLLAKRGQLPPTVLIGFLLNATLFLIGFAVLLTDGRDY